MLNKLFIKLNIIFFISLFQFCILFLSSLFLYLNNFLFLTSFICGGLISFLSSCMFCVFFLINLNNNPNNILKHFYFLMFFKLIFLFCVLLLFFKIGVSSPVYFFVSLIMCQIAFWFGCFLYFFIWGFNFL